MKKLIKLFLAAGGFAVALPMSGVGINRSVSSVEQTLKVVSEWQKEIPAAKVKISNKAIHAEKAPSLSNMRINGFLMYDDDRTENTLGFYEYTTTAPVTRRALAYVPRQYVGGDAVVYDGTLYTYHVDQSYGFVNSAFYTTIDVATGKATKGSNISYDLGVAMEHAATSAAVNPVDGTVYCAGYTYNEDKTLTPTLKIWNLKEQTKTAVGNMQAMLSVMAFDASGNLYGITSCSSKGSDDGGRLVSVDKTTGTLTLIGDTGIRPWFDQSGVISPYDGKLYWFANEPLEGNDANAAKATLYTVSLTDAAVTAAGELPNGDEVVGAWFPTQTIADDAPGVVTDLKAVFTAPALAGSLSFTLPAESYTGDPLQGELNWVVSSDSNELAKGAGNPGEQVNAPVKVENSGKYTFSVSVANGSGEGLPVELSQYIGYGVPASPKDVKFAVENGSNLISWTHSEGVVGEGYLEGEHPQYRIVRQPGNVVLEEKWDGNSYTEPALDGELQSTYYEIIPVNGDMQGASARSNSLVTGSSLALPYSEDFTDASSFDLFTAIDSNNDANTWYYSVKSAKIRQATAGEQDDWLVLPPVRFVKGYSYEFKFNCYALQVANVNILDVAMGTTAEDMSTTLIENLEVKDTKSTAMKEVAVTVKPTETAVYRLGIHLKSASRQGTFTVDDITISAGTSTEIPAAPVFSIEPAAKGGLSAVLNIDVPELTAGGSALENRPSVFEIERDGAMLATMEITADKNSYTYNDEAISKAGNYTYTVRAVNADGKGEIAEQSVFIGCDKPMAPTGFNAKDNFDGTVTLSWDEPSEAGANLGYVDTDRVRYTVTHPDGTVTSEIKGTSLVVAHDVEGVQKEVAYTLGIHYAEEPVEASVKSNTLIAGKPYKDAFKETFPVTDGSVTPLTAVWVKEVVEGKSSSMTISMRTDADHTGDNGGGLHFTFYSADAAARWITPVLNIAEIKSPEVTLWVKTPDNKSAIEIQVSKEYGEWETIATPADTQEWTEVKVSLKDYASPHVRLGILTRSSSNFGYAYVDDVDVHESDMSAVDVVAADNDSEQELFNLQGIHVQGNPVPGVYILRRGSEVSKIIVK